MNLTGRSEIVAWASLVAAAGLGAEEPKPAPAGPKPAPGRIDLRVLPGDRGDADPDDIAAVCRSAAAELLALCPGRDLGVVTVERSAEGPIVLFRPGPKGERRIRLDVSDRHWAQPAYQFAHELCHLLCNTREADTANLWFEESLCEAASLFVLRRMAETWKTRPPYRNGKGYAGSPADYARARIDDTAGPGGAADLSEWRGTHGPALRRNPHDRALNRVAAVRLPALLEKDPSRWEAVGVLNRWDKDRPPTFAEYLADWRARLPEARRGCVDEVAALFGVRLG
jgi:hypothetical protein